MHPPEVAEARSDERGGEPAPAPRARRAPAVFAVALLLVLVQLAWRAWLLRDAYFFGDDLTLTGKAADTGLTLEYLLHPHAVHVMPVSLAVVWIVTALDPYNWTLAAASLVLMQAGASLAVWRMLTVVFGRRPGLLVPYAVYLFTPLTVPAFHWWAAGIQTLPFQAAIAMSVASHVTYLRRRRARDAVATCAWFLLGLGSFHVKAALAIPLVLFGITLLYFARGRPLRALRRDARALAAYALLPVLYSLLLIVQFGEVTQEARAPSGEQFASFAAGLLGVTFPTVAVGGPGSWFSVMASPPPALIALAWTVIAALVLGTLWARRGSWRAWLLLALYLPLVDLAPVVLGRGEVLELAREVRYLADSAPVLALVLALATLPLSGETRPYRREAPPRPALARAGYAALALAVTAFAAFSALSANRYVTGLARERVPVESYLTAARATLAAAPPGTDLYPQRLPGSVLVFGLLDEDFSHRTISPLAPPELAALMRHPRPTSRPMVLDATARRLVPATVMGGFAVPRGTACFPADGGVIELPLAHGDRLDVLKLTYRASLPTAALVRPQGAAPGEGETEISFEQGEHEIYLPLSGPESKKIRIEVLTPEAAVCVTAAVNGTVVPR